VQRQLNREVERHRALTAKNADEKDEEREMVEEEEPVEDVDAQNVQEFNEK